MRVLPPHLYLPARVETLTTKRRMYEAALVVGDDWSFDDAGRHHRRRLGSDTDVRGN
jgi:hypothetical protein